MCKDDVFNKLVIKMMIMDLLAYPWYLCPTVDQIDPFSSLNQDNCIREHCDSLRKSEAKKEKTF